MKHKLKMLPLLCTALVLGGALLARHLMWINSPAAVLYKFNDAIIQADIPGIKACITAASADQLDLTPQDELLRQLQRSHAAEAAEGGRITFRVVSTEFEVPDRAIVTILWEGYFRPERQLLNRENGQWKLDLIRTKLERLGPTP